MHLYLRQIIMKMKIKMKNRSPRYNIHSPRSRLGHKFSKYKKCRSMMMLICINPFVPNAIFLYLLKTSENCKERVHWERKC